MTITFIQNPPYIVNFKDFNPIKKEQTRLTTPQKVSAAAMMALLLIKYSFESLTSATYVTLKYSGTSFKHIVLNLNGEFRFPVADVALAGLRVAVWVFSMAWCLVTTTNRNFLQKVYGESYDSNQYLQNFIGKEINILHVKSQDVDLDATMVPKEITVDSLSKIFEEINFSQPDLPGYMTPASLKEGSAVYTVDQMKESLATFIDHVTRKVPFLGTPPAYDTPRLMAFYLQIENAVRLSIQKANENLEQFKANNGTDPAAYDDEQMKKYKNLLEDRARLAIDLAIAGKHCGARYMGESMSVYYSFNGEDLREDKNLEETLIEILAHKRKQIAESQIQTYLGTGEGELKTVDTHSWNKYMANIGQLLGIPGTRNIIEHLDTTFDKDDYLKKFFKAYTVDAITAAIQEKVKKSGSFRTKIIDWVKDQVKDWKKDTIDASLQKNVVAIQKILSDAALEDNVRVSHIQDLIELINELKARNVVLPDLNNDWSDYIQELFALKDAREWFPKKYNTTPMELAKKKQLLRATCSKDILGDDLLNHLKASIVNGTPLDIKLFSDRFSLINKIEKIRAIQPINQDSILRVIEGKSDLAEVIRDHLNTQRGNKFITKFNFESIDKDGLTSEMIEWILVSQKILMPQEETESHNVTITAADQYIQRIQATITAPTDVNIEIANLGRAQRQFPSPFNFSIDYFVKNENAQEVDAKAKQILAEFPQLELSTSKTRYKFNKLSNRDTLLKLVFDRCFEYDPDKVTEAAQRAESAPQPYYPLWKRAVYINLSSGISAVTGNFLIKLALATAATVGAYFALFAAYDVSSTLIAARFIPFVINNAHLNVIKAANKVFSAMEWLAEWRGPLFLATCAFYIGTRAFGPEIPYLSRFIRRYKIWDLAFAIFRTPQTALGFILQNSLNPAIFAWKTCNTISYYFKSVAQSTETERLHISKQRSYEVWSKIIQQGSAPQVAVA